MKKKMSHRKKGKGERLRSAAIVKIKYKKVAGKIDEGFKEVYKGILEDLIVSEEEVDKYIERNKEELKKICQ